MSSPVLFDYPNPRANVFIMMRFAGTKQHKSIVNAIRSALHHYGMNGLRADDKSYAQSLWMNVKSYMDASDFGIAVFEQIIDDNTNANVSLELGYMLAKGKRVLLLKENRFKTMPSDVVGHLYRDFDAFEIEKSVQSTVFSWLRDIEIAKSEAERLLLFVSYGGTCRCAMAKVALLQSLVGRNLPFRLRVISMAHTFAGINEASRGARRAVYETFGTDYLQEHRVICRNPGLLSDADLILVMEDVLREGLPPGKTFNFNEFFGYSGDIGNPWPDNDDEASQERYRSCLQNLKSVIDAGVIRILEHMEKVSNDKGAFK